jgi:cytochrome c oxidase assembly protein subunit 11
MLQISKRLKLTRNHVVFGSCFAVVVAMVGATYAAVPLYYIFCRATGYGGTPNRASAAPGFTVNRVMTVRFDSNVDPQLPWTFYPEQRSVDVRVGENRLVFFRAVNNSHTPITGHASFNVQPDDAARYFTKIQCFCFTEQTLAPGESVEMPVSFFVSPKIVHDHDDDSVSEITLSYTFYPSATQNTETKAKAAAVALKGTD